jgi:cyanophycin synthetase
MMNIADELTRQAEAMPDAVAVIMPTGTLSFRQLETLTWRAATFMHQRGISKGEVIAMSFSSELTLLIAFLAAVRLGNAVLTIPGGLPTTLRKEILEAAASRTLLSDRPVNWAEQRRTIIMTLDHLLRETGEIDLNVRDPEPKAYCVIHVGSGSTGKQKLIPYTHRQFMEIATRTSRQYSLSVNDRLATLVHPSFVATKRRYLSMISSGAAIVLFNRSRVDPVSLVKQYKVTVLIGAVVHFENLLSVLPEHVRNLMPGLRLLVITGSTVSTALRNRIAEKLTRNLCISYGANECNTMTWAQAPEVFEIEGTVGAPMEGASVEIVDSDGNLLPPGEIGQIRLHAPGMVNGYLNDTEASKKSFRGGWFYPGDLGTLTEMGQLIYCGRADDMMVMDGINIYPAEIEKIVTAHPAIKDAVTVAVKHTIHQDVPMCAVSLHTGMKVTPQEMLKYAGQRLGARGPRHMVILEEIPRDERGKLRRSELDQLIARRVKGAGVEET